MENPKNFVLTQLPARQSLATLLCAAATQGEEESGGDA